MPNTLMKAADFAAKLREKLPELSEFNDTQIINKILELRPDLTDKVENPLSGDMVAAKEQARTLEKADRDKDFTRSVMSALPATGAILGGTMGPMASALGAGVGRGAMDLGNQFLGLDNSSPLEKAKNIGIDTAITGATPGLMEFAKNPIQSSRIGARMLSGLEDSLIPNKLKPFIKPPFLEDFANGGSKKFDPLVRPSNMNMANSVVEDSPPTKRSIMYKYGKYIDKSTGEEIPMNTNTTNSKMMFNPKGQKGMTGSSKQTIDDVIKSLMGVVE